MHSIGLFEPTYYFGGGRDLHEGADQAPEQLYREGQGAAPAVGDQEDRKDHDYQGKERGLNQSLIKRKEVRSVPKVGIYCRLSIEDRDKGDAESQSIQNQKAMLREYCSERNWEIFDIYADA